MEDINGSRPNAAPKPKKRPNRFVRFLAFLVTLALMVGAVALVANYDKLNFDFIKRWFSYRTLARNDSGQAESFHLLGTPPTPLPSWTEIFWSAPPTPSGYIRAAVRPLWIRPFP